MPHPGLSKLRSPENDILLQHFQHVLETLVHTGLCRRKMKLRILRQSNLTAPSMTARDSRYCFWGTASPELPVPCVCVAMCPFLPRNIQCTRPLHGAARHAVGSPDLLPRMHREHCPGCMGGAVGRMESGSQAGRPGRICPEAGMGRLGRLWVRAGMPARQADMPPMAAVIPGALPAAAGQGVP